MVLKIIVVFIYRWSLEQLRLYTMRFLWFKGLQLTPTLPPTPSTTHGLKYWIAILVKSMIRYRLELFYVESAEYLQFQKSSVLISTFVGQTKIHLHTTYLCVNYPVPVCPA